MDGVNHKPGVTHLERTANAKWVYFIARIDWELFKLESKLEFDLLTTWNINSD